MESELHARFTHIIDCTRLIGHCEMVYSRVLGEANGSASDSGSRAFGRLVPPTLVVHLHPWFVVNSQPR
jgi:hypothetical protein